MTKSEHREKYLAKKTQNHRELRGNLRSVIYAQLQSHRQRERERERNTI